MFRSKYFLSSVLLLAVLVSSCGLLPDATPAPTALPETAAPVSVVEDVPVAQGSQDYTAVAPSESYLQILQAHEGELPPPPSPVLRTADDENGVKHEVLAIGTLYDLPQCYLEHPIEDFCAKKTWRYFLLDQKYLQGPGAGTGHLMTFADAKTFLMAQGYTADQYVKILHSPYLHGTGFNPLHPGEGQVKVSDLDKLAGIGFIFTFAMDNTIPQWDPSVNYKTTE